MIICRNCGENIHTDDNFCPKCGVMNINQNHEGNSQYYHDQFQQEKVENQDSKEGFFKDKFEKLKFWRHSKEQKQTDQLLIQTPYQQPQNQLPDQQQMPNQQQQGQMPNQHQQGQMPNQQQQGQMPNQQQQGQMPNQQQQDQMPNQQQQDQMPNQQQQGQMPNQQQQGQPQISSQIIGSFILPDQSIISINQDQKQFGRQDFLRNVSEDNLKYISRNHFNISYKNGMYYIQDTKSAGGTKLNGNEIKNSGEIQLNKGDKILLADSFEIIFNL